MNARDHAPEFTPPPLRIRTSDGDPEEVPHAEADLFAHATLHLPVTSPEAVKGMAHVVLTLLAERAELYRALNWVAVSADEMDPVAAAFDPSLQHARRLLGLEE